MAILGAKSWFFQRACLVRTKWGVNHFSTPNRSGVIIISGFCRILSDFDDVIIKYDVIMTSPLNWRRYSKVLMGLYNRGKFHPPSVSGTQFSEGGQNLPPPVRFTIRNTPYRIGLIREHQILVKRKRTSVQSTRWKPRRRHVTEPARI